MKYFCLAIPILLFGINLNSCDENSSSHSRSEIVSIENDKDYNYFEISEYRINWNDIFEQKENKYFVYFYSLNCGACDEIKNTVIEFALKKKGPIYFVEQSENDVYCTDTMRMIGCEKIEDFAIKGHPSLVVINSKKITNFESGTREILSLINSS